MYSQLIIYYTAPMERIFTPQQLPIDTAVINTDSVAITNC